MLVLFCTMLEDGCIFPKLFKLDATEHKLLRLVIPHMLADSI